MLPPEEGYAPLEKAWRCIFSFEEACNGSIQGVSSQTSGPLDTPIAVNRQKASRWTGRDRFEVDASLRGDSLWGDCAYCAGSVGFGGWNKEATLLQNCRSEM